MDESRLALLQIEIGQLRRGYRRLQWLLVLSIGAAASLVPGILGMPGRVTAASVKTDRDGVLHVRGVVVEDRSGHERVRLGAPLPDPVIHGVRLKRKGAISGVLISDSNGNERGGYVTGDASGEAFLSLDSEDEQQVLFLANPGGGVNFDIFDSKGNEAAIRVFPGGPRFVMKKTKSSVLDLP
jgi:hypothetical protein